VWGRIALSAVMTGGGERLREREREREKREREREREDHEKLGFPILQFIPILS